MEGATTVDSNAPHPAPFASKQDSVPLSFPAILRNPGLNGRFAHLTDTRAASPSVTAKKIGRRDENNGRRWVRRKENNRFVGNPHIVLATRQDYGVQLPKVKSTFPEPLPTYLPRTAKLPVTGSPVVDPSSANYGRFSLSLKGMRRELRRSGRRAQFLVRDVEQAMTDWLATAGAVLASDSPQSMGSERQMIGECQTIHEVSRTPFQLVWSCDSDPFARYVVHCCARYHDVVSYSKEVSGERFTYLLRPNVTRPDFFAPAAIATPPVTDIDSSSQFDTESDFTDLDSFSEVDEVASLAASSRESLVHVTEHDSEEACNLSIDISHSRRYTKTTVAYPRTTSHTESDSNALHLITVTFSSTFIIHSKAASNGCILQTIILCIFILLTST
ncbi:hypothetical protein CPB85DRAFT_1429410 [Mucidula mucida]|nr:hypothetical protein CPB85DRAFT_1429410 [Mucidula mucida]